jgi:hypothetical protein
MNISVFDFANYGLYEWVRLLVYVIGVPIIVLLLRNAARRVRDIKELDARLREEEAQNAKNPYAEMAKAMEARELLERARRER